ncbi:MAG: indolepyruvate oxidoreductase subunit beta [Eubacteriales bacterium]|nr:indolepyruvate oxidoreductase subunit beta [Eubacteriales bacterium]
MKYDMIISGVGGQGALLAAKVLANLAVLNGLDVKLSEVHGMAQRGGSVITHVRMGENVQSPLVSLGEADFVISFEWLEALRAEDYLKEGGKLLALTQEIMPITVITGSAKYPEQVKKDHIVAFDALKLAKQAGNARCVNVVMLGALSNFLPFSEEHWIESLTASIKPKLLQTNIVAFKLGRELNLEK